MELLDNKIFKARVQEVQIDYQKLQGNYEIIENSVNALEFIIKSERFKQEIISYNGGKGFYYVKKSFFNHVCKIESNSDVFNSIIFAREKFGSDLHVKLKDYVADLFFNINTDPSQENILACIHPRDVYIEINHRTLSEFSIPQFTSLIAHEWMHTLGFHHPPVIGENQDYVHGTIPYVIQNIIYWLCIDYQNSNFNYFT